MVLLFLKLRKISRTQQLVGQLLLLKNKYLTILLLGLRAVKLLATYLENPSNNEIVMFQLKEWLSSPVASGNKTVQMIAATLFMYEDNMKEAFKVIKNGSNLEQ